jgi:hypothetical protein
VPRSRIICYVCVHLLRSPDPVREVQHVGGRAVSVDEAPVDVLIGAVLERLPSHEVLVSVAACCDGWQLLCIRPGGNGQDPTAQDVAVGVQARATMMST